MTSATPGRPRSARVRAFKNNAFVGVAMVTALISVLALGWLLFSIVRQGGGNLVGIDAEARADAQQPRIPDEWSDLQAVDWRATADRLDLPVLSELANVSLGRVGRVQDFEYADEVTQVDWTRVDGIASDTSAERLAAINWPAVLNEIRVPGDGWLEATWSSSKLGSFMTNPPSRRPARAGIGPALWGTLWICAVCAIFALPIGVGTAIFLEEYRPKAPWARKAHAVIQLNISNLAGVPSIVYGLIGLTAFVQLFGVLGNANEPAFTLGTAESTFYFQLPFGRGVLAGGLTLMLVILPIIIISAQEALRAVPNSLRQGSLALGSTRWQTIRRMTLPSAIPGIMTGAILAMSRAIGEAAPVLIICGIVFIRFTPNNLMDDFTALPLQIYDWAGRPQDEFHAVAAAGIIVLLAALLAFNALAVFVRQTFSKPLQ